MALDVYTLFVCELYVMLFLIIIMVFAWRGAQYDRALGYLCLALGLTIIALWLSSLRANGALFLPVAVGNALVIIAYAVLINAFRALRGAGKSYGWLCGALLWGLLCLSPTFYSSLPLRIVASCLICAAYTGVMILEVSRARNILSVTWWPAQLLLWLHVSFNLLRIMLDSAVSSIQPGAVGGSDFSVWVILESIMLVIGLNFTFLAMVNERNQRQYKQASLLDPLTGVWNRRALFQLAEEYRLQCDRSHMPLSVLLFDLDHFKSINDRFGHTTGDRVLVDFCRIAQAHMPADGHFARLGGEEFAALLLMERKDAHGLAEKIRYAVTQALPDNVPYTVSIGVACARGHEISVGQLMSEADEALYRAKAQGRNCVISLSHAWQPETTRVLSVPG